MMVRRKTDKEFKEQVHSMTGNEYTFLDEYVKVTEKLRVKHNNCGRIYEVTPARFLRGARCKNCSFKKIGERMRKSQEEFEDELKDLTEGRFQLLSEYKGSKSKIQLKHLDCGHVFKVFPYNFCRVPKCPNCSEKIYRGKTLLQRGEEFEEDLQKIYGSEFCMVGKYLGYHSKTEFKHSSCGTIVRLTPSSLLLVRGCPVCGVNKKRDTEIFKAEVTKKGRGDYEFRGDYTGTKVKSLFYHKKCGREYYALPGNFIKGSRCPFCNASRGESEVDFVLSKLGVTFEREKLIGGTLRMDFYLPDFFAFIEYDGKQHFNSVNRWGGEEAFIKSQYRDAVKDNYCRFLGIPLLRIPYWEFDNIETIVKEFLNELENREAGIIGS